MSGRKKGTVCPALIRRAIRLAGNQSALSRVLGVTRQTVSSWMRRGTWPTGPRYKKLLKFAGRRGR